MNKKTPITIGIVGHGFVGKAVDHGFPGNTGPDDCTESTDPLMSSKRALVTRIIIDPQLNTTIEADLAPANPSFVFVAVPTPMGGDGIINSTIIEDTITKLAALESNPIIIIKSTITPAVIDKLEAISKRIVYNPEFLTERNAKNDFVNAEVHVFGGNRADVMAVHSLYETYSICKMEDAKIFYVDTRAASMLKYTLNCWLASKVTFFNQLKEVYELSGTTTPWEDFVLAVGADRRVGSSHMQVPGLDGRYGWGGACFGKDTMAMLRYADSVGKPLSVLREAVAVNQVIRSQYELDSREKEQNVSFKQVV